MDIPSRYAVGFHSLQASLDYILLSILFALKNCHLNELRVQYGLFLFTTSHKPRLATKNFKIVVVNSAVSTTLNSILFDESNLRYEAFFAEIWSLHNK